MNWAKENKFLTGYGLVMLIGIGALGYKVFSAAGAYDEASTKYTAKASSYNTLRRLVPYPNRENLAAFEVQKKEAADVITAFQGGLAKREFPLEQISPERFQDALRKAATDVNTKAAAANVTLKTKEKFYYGFNRYETAPPDKDATALLYRDLKAIEWIVDQLIETPVTELLALNRPELPEEKGGRTAAAARPAVPGNRTGISGKDLVSAHTFDLVIDCKQHQLAKFLNTIISPNAPQFYIPRNVRILNSSPKPPPRVDPSAAAAAAAPPVDPAAPAGPGAKPANAAAGETIKYIVGEESVEATIRIEIVDFAEPAAPSAPATPAGK